MDSNQFLILKYQIIWTSKLDNVEEFNDLLFQEQDSLNDVKFSVQTELLLKRCFGNCNVLKHGFRDTNDAEDLQMRKEYNEKISKERFEFIFLDSVKEYDMSY